MDGEGFSFVPEIWRCKASPPSAGISMIEGSDAWKLFTSATPRIEVAAKTAESYHVDVYT